MWISASQRSWLLSTSSSEERFWRQFGNGGWVSHTLVVVTFVFLWQFARFQIIPRFLLLFRNPGFGSAVQFTNPTVSSAPLSQQHRISEIITDSDLKNLMDNLDESVSENDKWETVVDRGNNSLSYIVKCCKTKDGGPLKYLSTTIFKSCSSEMLRDFYMDNFYRKEWDKTLIEHEQLQVDEGNGTEIGRMIKKFPLLTPREYILAWRLWEGRDQTYYCYSKECEHPLAPRQKKYVRVGVFRSGWRIREVPGRDSCEIKMIHQEDAGLKVEIAKLIFAKGIWSYVCKMDNALRKYPHIRRLQLTSSLSAITLLQKVPETLDSNSIAHSEASIGQAAQESKERKVCRRPSKKLIANGLILVGGVICVTRGHTNLSAKLAVAYILGKLGKRTREPRVR